MLFTNHRINESIIQDLSNLLSKSENEADQEIKVKMIPQFKKDLKSLWNIFSDETRNKLFYMIPDSWNKEEFVYDPPKQYA